MRKYAVAVMIVAIAAALGGGAWATAQTGGTLPNPATPTPIVVPNTPEPTIDVAAHLEAINILLTEIRAQQDAHTQHHKELRSRVDAIFEDQSEFRSSVDTDILALTTSLEQYRQDWANQLVTDEEFFEAWRVASLTLDEAIRNLEPVPTAVPTPQIPGSGVTIIECNDCSVGP